jgi:choline-glycine betaine transporter
MQKRTEMISDAKVVDSGGGDVELAQVVEPITKKNEPSDVYDDPVNPDICSAEEMGYGSGKCGLYEVSLGSNNDSWLCQKFVFNPYSSIIGTAILWGFTIYCIVDQAEARAKMSTWQTWVTDTFTWFYIGSQGVWIFFLFYLYYAYGKVKLGKEGDKVEFENVTYFAMIFSAGVAVGLFVYGTAEPLYHYDYWLKQRFNSDDATTDNDKANFALLTTLFHWGFHGFCVYSLVGITMGILSYRDGLPLLMRTCFYPLLGKHTWGWIGDLIDGFSIVTIVAGVCTSLGLGTIQIKTGLWGLNALPDECYSGKGANAYEIAKSQNNCEQMTYVTIIWVITAIATVSVVSGIKRGIKTLSQIAFGAGVFIWVCALFFDNTWFLLDTIVQMVGYYLMYFMTTLGWHTDAFARAQFGSGGAPDSAGVGSVTSGPVGTGASKAGQVWGSYGNFMDAWTIFYWGWWIAWSPFVGMFISRISRGRTVREVFNYTLTGPLLFALIWFGVFGGAAIEMENNAQLIWQAGADLYGDPTWFQMGQHGRPAASFDQAYSNAIQFRVEPCFGTGESGGACGRCGAFSFNATETDNCKYDGTKWHYGGAACKPRCRSADFLNAAQNPYDAYTDMSAGPFRDSQPCIPDGAAPKMTEGCGACFQMYSSFSTDVTGGGAVCNDAAHQVEGACKGNSECHWDVVVQKCREALSMTEEERKQFLKEADITEKQCNDKRDDALCTPKTGCQVFAANPANTNREGKTRACPIYIKNWEGRPEISPVCLFTDWDQEASWYNTVNQYGGDTLFLCGLSVFTLVVYFITSSDSGSLVVDTLSGNGRDENNPFQRVFWAITEGAVATALVTAQDVTDDPVGGVFTVHTTGKNILKSLQAASICCGLPFTFLLCFMMPSLLYALENKKRKNFKIPVFGGIFDCIEHWISWGKCDFPWDHITPFFINLAAPFMAIQDIQETFESKGQAGEMWGSVKINSMFVLITATACWISWIVLLAVHDTSDGGDVWQYGWVCYICFATFVGFLRSRARKFHKIDGNVIWDFFAAVVFYPQVLYQIQHEFA